MSELASLARLEVRLRWMPLLRGHVWIRDAVIDRPVVRIVRSADGLNVSDLFESSGAPVARARRHGGAVRPRRRPRDPRGSRARRAKDVDVREHPGPRAERVDRARRRRGRGQLGDGGSADVGPARAHPIEPGTLRRRAGGPPGSTSRWRVSTCRRTPRPPSIAAGRARPCASRSTPRSGIRAEGTGALEDLALVATRSGEDLVRVASMTTRLTGLEFRDEQLAVGRFDAECVGERAESRGAGQAIRFDDGAREPLRSLVAGGAAGPSRSRGDRAGRRRGERVGLAPPAARGEPAPVEARSRQRRAVDAASPHPGPGHGLGGVGPRRERAPDGGRADARARRDRGERPRRAGRPAGGPRRSTGGGERARGALAPPRRGRARGRGHPARNRRARQVGRARGQQALHSAAADRCRTRQQKPGQTRLATRRPRSR